MVFQVGWWCRGLVGAGERARRDWGEMPSMGHADPGAAVLLSSRRGVMMAGAMISWVDVATAEWGMWN